MTNKWKTDDKRTHYFYVENKAVGFVDIDFKQPMGSIGKFYKAFTNNRNLGEFKTLKEAKNAVTRNAGV